MKLKFYTTLLLSVLAVAYSYGQDSTTTLPEFTDITLLPTVINSGAEEIKPVIADNGQRLYFTRVAHKENVGGKLGAQDIWYAEKDKDGNWKKAVNFREFNNAGHNAITGVDRKSGRLYLLNSYEDNMGNKTGISFSDPKGENQWTLPVITRIQGIYNTGLADNLYELSVNQDSDVLLISMRSGESLGEEDLFVSFKFTGWNRFHNAAESAGKEGFYWWSPPVHLGNVVNSASYEISPYLCPDGKTLFFASDRKGGYGNADIYVTTRLDDTWQNWTTPVNLGRGINSSRFDAYLYLAEDSTAYFSSARKGRLSEIYTARLKPSVQNLLEKSVAETPGKPDMQQSGEEDKIVFADATDEPLPELPQVVETVEELEELNKIKWFVRFDNNSYSLLLKDKEVLERTVKVMRANSRLTIYLSGHTDDVGSPQQNRILAEKRADSVRKYLKRNGIKDDRIIASSAGEAKPLIAASSSYAREQNRRVELTFKLVE